MQCFTKVLFTFARIVETDLEESRLTLYHMYRLLLDTLPLKVSLLR